MKPRRAKLIVSVPASVSRPAGTAFAAASLALAIAVAILWAQSYVGGIGLPNRVRVDALGHRWGFTTWDGLAWVQWSEANTGNRKVRDIRYEDMPVSSLTLGFGLRVAPTGVVPPGFTLPYARHGIACLPMWFVFALAVIAPMLWMRARRQRRLESLRNARLRCVRCGYDLRATPERCPECGTAPAHEAGPPHYPPMQRTVTASSGAVE